MGVEVPLFLLFGLVAIAFAIGLLISENAVHSALFLIGNFGCVAFMYLMLNAPFISMVQVAVYAGAIMVLFLFVIMLLGGEQTTDTTRRFRWVAGAATILGASLLFSLALPLVGGFRLPEFEGNAPVVRFAHAAIAPEMTIELSGEGLPQPITYENLQFNEVTAFASVPAGTYTLNMRRADDGAPLAPPQSITLETNQFSTLTATGELNLDEGTFVQLLTLPNSLDEAGNKQTRLIVYNGYVDTPLTLVNLGADKVMNVVTRDGVPVITDPVLADNIEYNGAPVVANYPAGDYTLAFVRSNLNADGNVTGYEVVHTLGAGINEGFTLDTDTEVPLLLVPDAEQPASDAGYRPTLISGLTFDAAAPFGSPKAIGRVLFTDYLLPVNLVGLLLLVALLGVIVLNRPDGEKQDRRTNVRRKVSRPLVNVIAQQTGGDVVVETPKLPSGE